MSLWRVYELFGCNGNPVEGYEGCESRNSGALTVRDEWTEEQFIKALAEQEHLNKNALEMFRGGELSFESDHGDGYELGEVEQAWARVNPEDDAWQYLESGYEPGMTPGQVASAEDEGLPPEAYELMTGHRPVMRIEPEYPDDEARPFWRGKVKHTYKALVAEPDRGWIEAVVELRINPEKMTRKTGVFLVHVYVDGEFFGPRDFPGDFEDGEALGLAEGPMARVVEAYPDDVSEQRVALDAFLEKGGVADARFLKVLVKEDAKALFRDDPDLPRLVEKDGVTNGSEHWPDSIDIGAADIRAIREDFRAWATRQVDREADELEEYVKALYKSSRPAGSPQYTKPQLEVLKQWYRSGVISGLAMWARGWVDRHGDEFLGEDESERTGAVDVDDEIEAVASGLSHGRNPTAAQLRNLPTLSTAQTADLKFDDGHYRVWLERVGVEDGARWDDGVVIEELIDGRWETVTEYAG